jgi:hypothetical protein
MRINKHILTETLYNTRKDENKTLADKAKTLLTELDKNGQGQFGEGCFYQKAENWIIGLLIDLENIKIINKFK